MGRIIEHNWKQYKKCNQCWVTKEVTEYKSNWYNKNWVKVYKPTCKYCFNLMERNSRILKTEQYLKVKANRNKYREENKEKCKEYNKKYYANLSKYDKKKIMVRNTNNRYKRNWFIYAKIRWIKIKILRII